MDINKIFKLLVVGCILFICFYGCKEKNTIKKTTYTELSGNALQDSVSIRIYENIDSPIFNYKDGLKRAQEYDKKMLIMFSSIACVNCRKFEVKVLFNSEIKTLISKDFIPVFLFADDKRKLIGVEKKRSTIGNRELKTIGHYNCEIQRLKVQSGSLPEIYMFSNTEEVLDRYDFNFKLEKFKDWLKSNLND